MIDAKHARCGSCLFTLAHYTTVFPKKVFFKFFFYALLLKSWWPNRATKSRLFWNLVAHLPFLVAPGHR